MPSSIFKVRIMRVISARNSAEFRVVVLCALHTERIGRIGRIVLFSSRIDCSGSRIVLFSSGMIVLIVRLIVCDGMGYCL